MADGFLGIRDLSYVKEQTWMMVLLGIRDLSWFCQVDEIPRSYTMSIPNRFSLHIPRSHG